jgi:hypothetical protein
MPLPPQRAEYGEHACLGMGLILTAPLSLKQGMFRYTYTVVYGWGESNRRKAVEDELDLWAPLFSPSPLSLYSRHPIFDGWMRQDARQEQKVPWSKPRKG